MDNVFVEFGFIFWILLVTILNESKHFKMITKKLKEEKSYTLNDWLPYDEVKHYFDYKSTQMWELSKKLEVAKIGKRKFISRKSIEFLLNNSLD